MKRIANIHQEGANRGRRKKLRSLAFLPNVLTIGNLLCGFAAIHFALRSMYEFGAGYSDAAFVTLNSAQLERVLPSALSIAAGLIILGMIFDCFDGLIARVTRSTTNFGGQLDSLADVVTCGAAPATLMIVYMTRELASASITPSPISEHFLGRATWVSAAFYLAFAAIRLARYNVEHALDGFDHRSFRGLPTPGAAAFIVTIILLHEQLGVFVSKMIVYFLPVLAFATAFLMVSRIPYKRFYRAYLLGRKPFGSLLIFMLIFAVFWSYKAPTMMMLVLWYWISGPVDLLMRWVQGRRHGKTPETSTSSNSTAGAA